MQIKTPHTYLTKTNLQWLKDENTMWKLQNEDEINECHKSQLEFEYNFYLLNYTIK